MHSDPEIAALQQKFWDAREDFRSFVMGIQQSGFRYMNAPSMEQSFSHFDEYEKKVKAGEQSLEKLKSVGMELFYKYKEKSEKADDELVYFMSILTERVFEDGYFEKAYDLTQKLSENNPENKFAEIYRARAGMLTNRFGKDIELLIRANEEFFSDEENISNIEKGLVSNLFVLKSAYEKELEIREQEAKKDDLPIIKLQTSKGNIEIELFEDDAPDSVGNIVSLVEKKHYDGLIFHTVITRTAAETGVIDENFAVRPIGYKIYDEERKRNIFAGSVVMVSEKRNTGDSRFFIALAPLPNVSGTQTVVGRVKTGMDVVYSINKTHAIEEDNATPIEGAKPDKIIAATVVRKRDHEYKPNKVTNPIK